MLSINLAVATLKGDMMAINVGQIPMKIVWMFDESLGFSLHKLHNQVARDRSAEIQKGLKYFVDNLEKFEEKNVGREMTIEQIYNVFSKLAKECSENPWCIIKILY